MTISKEAVNWNYIMEAVKRLNFRKLEKPDIQKIFHGDIIVQKVISRHIDGQNVSTKTEL